MSDWARVMACSLPNLRPAATRATRKRLKAALAFTKSCTKTRRFMNKHWRNSADPALVTDGLRIKPYPCGGLTHQVIDSVLEFRAKQGLTPEMIDRVDVDVVKPTFDRIVFRVPQTGIQGKFCMPYLVARAIIDGKIGLHIFTDSAVRDSNVLKLAERVQMNLDPNLKKSDAAGRPCRLTVRLKNGQTYTREAQHAKGGPEYPMSEDELRGKFTECAREALDPNRTALALEFLDHLESAADIGPLCEIL